LANINAAKQARPAICDNFFARAFARLFIHIGNDDSSAIFGKPPCARQANAMTCTGNNDDTP
jgi:hypothetical protein